VQRSEQGTGVMSRFRDEVRRELDGWAERGLRARFWVRDDDACEASAPLAQLHDLAAEHDIIIGLAVIPGKIRPSLLEFLTETQRRFYPMCHGWQHINHARPGRKPSEFGGERAISALIEDGQSALCAFREHFGDREVVFVPPFGQISSAMVKALPEIGFAGLSTGPGWLERKLSILSSFKIHVPKVHIPKMKIWHRPGVRRLDVQIDPIDWRRRTAHAMDTICGAIVRCLRPRRMGFISSDVPIGLVTHHLAHDTRIWETCNDVLGLLRRHGGVEFLDAGEFFTGTTRRRND